MALPLIRYIEPSEPTAYVAPDYTRPTVQPTYVPDRTAYVPVIYTTAEDARIAAIKAAAKVAAAKLAAARAAAAVVAARKKALEQSTTGTIAVSTSEMAARESGVYSTDRILGRQEATGYGDIPDYGVNKASILPEMSTKTMLIVGGVLAVISIGYVIFKRK